MDRQWTQLQVLMKGGKTQSRENYITNQAFEICYMVKDLNGPDTCDKLSGKWLKMWLSGIYPEKGHVEGPESGGWIA